MALHTDGPSSIARTSAVTQVAALAGQARVQHERATAESLRLLARDTGGTLWLDDDTAASVVARLRR